MQILCPEVDGLPLLLEGLGKLFFSGTEFCNKIDCIFFKDNIFLSFFVKIPFKQRQSHIQLFFVLIFVFNNPKGLHVGVMKGTPLEFLVFVLINYLF